MNAPHSGTLNGLPLTPEQMREIEHYLHRCERTGVPWDTPELAAMLDDMLNPPEAVEEEKSDVQDCIAAERTVAENEESDQFDLLRSERDRGH
jgi:hypothetical protein